LAVVRSLGRRGLEIHGGWHLPGSVAIRSKYMAKVHQIPPYNAEDDAWRRELTSILEREKFDLVIPCNDSSMFPLQASRAQFERHAHLTIPKELGFEVASSKTRTDRMAKSLGVAVPKGETVARGTDPDAVLSRYGFPLVLKPRSSFSLRRPDAVHRVVKVEDRERFEMVLESMLFHDPEVLVQEHFDGVGAGMELLADKGEILVAFQHLRVHEPFGGGGSTYRKSVDVDPVLMAAAAALMGALSYTGVAMVEFRVNTESGDWVLMEINGRFWGSLPLAVAAGADFPFYLYEFLVDGKRDFPQSYRTGLFCRNLTLDAAWIVRNFRGARSRNAQGARSTRRVAAELLNVLRLRESSDTFVWGDLRVGFFELGTLARRVARRMTRKPRILMMTLPPVRALYARRARRALVEGQSILFVCKGNICRSPFAESYARSLLPRSTQVRSVGHIRTEGRRTPEEGVEVAGYMGVDLAGHRSAAIGERMVRDADSIFVFDGENYDFLRRRYPFSRSKIHFLGVLNRKGPLVIQDPYGKDRSAFEIAYTAIARALAPRARESLEGGEHGKTR
jgi:protein-tyrosine-phosphatase/predicted ATP-grasp superfamily ATP-dependent carboligase